MVYHNWLLLVRNEVTGKTIDPDRVKGRDLGYIASDNPAGEDQSISSALSGTAVQPTNSIFMYLPYLLLSYSWRFQRHNGRYLTSGFSSSLLTLDSCH